jgi:hypothetical protein
MVDDQGIRAGQVVLGDLVYRSYRVFLVDQVNRASSSFRNRVPAFWRWFCYVALG